MIEAFDYLTVLSISNYLLLATEEDAVSREWLTTGSFKELVTRIEEYVYEAQNPMKRPIITGPQRDKMWAKETRCEPTKENNDSWKVCGNKRIPRP